MKKNHIVLTTINIPTLLIDYYANLKLFSHLDTTKVWVIGDKKTPKEVFNLTKEITQKGLETIYVDISMQDSWGVKFPDFYKTIPFNNETRRNVGYLMALENGCEKLISIDDDNFPTNYDFIGGHNITGKVWNESVLYEDKGFHNICEYLLISPDRDIYPRGYPFRLRGTKNKTESICTEDLKIIGVNAGLWLMEPDVDATTWLNGKILATEYTGLNHYVLNQDLWTPINTQNTSVIRALIPAFLCIPMGWDVPGGKIQRYGDIWGGYFLEAILKGTPYYVAFGQPLVEHRRNPHDYVDDLRFEFWGMILTDILLDALKNKFRPEGQDICERVIQLAVFLKSDFINEIPPWCSKEVIDFIHNTSNALDIWAKTCRHIGLS
jgi:hypothetical protein